MSILKKKNWNDFEGRMEGCGHRSVKENLSEMSEESSSETSRWSGIETVNYKISVSFVFIPFHVIEVTIHFVSYA